MVIHPFPAGFAHHAADRRIRAAPQQTPLQFVDAQPGKDAPAHLFAHQIDIRPHFTLLHRQQGRVIGKRRPETFRGKFNGDADSLGQRADRLQHVVQIVNARRKHPQHQVFIFSLHGAGHGIKAAAIDGQAPGVALDLIDLALCL